MGILFADLDFRGSGKGGINWYNLDALMLPTSQAIGVGAIVGYPVNTVPVGYTLFRTMGVPISMFYPSNAIRR
jgi:hypothetical protein